MRDVRVSFWHLLPPVKIFRLVSWALTTNSSQYCLLALVTLESEEGSGAGLDSEQRVIMGDIGETNLLRTVYY
jgi:hypothetical protein